MAHCGHRLGSFLPDPSAPPRVTVKMPDPKSSASPPPRGRRVGAVAVVALIATFGLAGCKDTVNPHASPESDVSVLVARDAGLIDAIPAAAAQSGQRTGRTVIQINNAPPPGKPIDQELAQREIEMFESRNPDIQVVYSTWQFTPDSFFERANNRTLTDVVEVAAEQMVPIMDRSYAADITDLVEKSPDFASLQPDALRFVLRDGRVFGTPVELSTMALFYNRHLLDRTLSPPAKPATPSQPAEKAKGKGADGYAKDPYPSEEPPAAAVAMSGSPVSSRGQWPLAGLGESSAMPREPRVIAQYFGYSGYDQGSGYQQQQGQQWGQQQRQTRRQQQATPQGYGQQQQQQQQGGFNQGYYQGNQGYYQGYNTAPQQPQQRARQTQQGYESYYNLQPTPEPGAPRPRAERPADSGDDSSRVSPGAGAGDPNSDIESANPLASVTKKTVGEDDILTGTDLAQAKADGTAKKDVVTTVVEQFDLPADWEQFIKLAVKLTDHSAGVYGYAPVVFAEEGGREYCQWGVQAGLQLETPDGKVVKTDVASSTSVEVVQFLKDLRWRYDVTPPLERCYFDNNLRMFASGQVAMVMLPANREIFERLRRLGMPIEDIGVAPLPAGPANRRHLTTGRCLIVSSQIDREKREAAVRWLMFQHDPARIVLRQRFLFREKELTGIPSVPLYRQPRMGEVTEMVSAYRAVPLFAAYEREIGACLWPLPPYNTSAFLTAVADGARPIIERKESVPSSEIAAVGAGFGDRPVLGSSRSMSWREVVRKLVMR